MTQTHNSYDHLSFGEKFELLSESQAAVLGNLVEFFSQNGNEPIPFPDNSTAAAVNFL